MMHEFGHLAGLDGDAETGSLKSPECLRNYALMECGIVDSDTLFSGETEGKSDEDDSHEDNEVGRHGELPFNPNQARVPKGSSEGGQFASGDGFGAGGSDSPKGDDKQPKPEKEKPDDSDKTSSNKPKKDDSAPESGDSNGGSGKGDLNLQSGGVKVDDTGNWCAGNIDIDGLEPNEPYTVVVETDYEITDKNGEISKESSKIAIDAVADDEGKISVDRVGLVGEYNHDSNKFTKDSLGLDVDVTTSVAKGTVKDNYGDPDKPQFEKEASTGEIKEAKDKYGLGYYGATHAAQEQWVNPANRPSDYKYNGGGVMGRDNPKDLQQIGKSKIKYEKNGKKTTIEGGKNTAKGKY